MKGTLIQALDAHAKSLLTRMGYVKRKCTTNCAGKNVTLEDYDERKISFQSQISRVLAVHSIPEDLIINFDQTDISLVQAGHRTLEQKRAQRVKMSWCWRRMPNHGYICCYNEWSISPNAVVIWRKDQSMSSQVNVPFVFWCLPHFKPLVEQWDLPLNCVQHHSSLCHRQKKGTSTWSILPSFIDFWCIILISDILEKNKI